MGVFWIISLEIGGYIIQCILGDYRGKYRFREGSRVEVSVFTSVISHSPQVYKGDFPVFLGSIFADVSET